MRIESPTPVRQAAGTDVSRIDMRVPHTLILLALLASGAIAWAEEPPEGVEDLGRFVPYDMQVDDEGRLTWIVTRVLDGWTREPVAGATVDVLREAAHPAPGKHGPMAETKTDEEGWARIYFDPPLAPKERPHWIRAHHPDYASTAEFSVSPEELLLQPRGEARIRVLDPLHRPVTNALLDHLLGCGHCPTVLQARTNEEGIGILRGVQGEALAQTWLVSEGLYGEYAEHTGWLPGDVPIDHLARWSITYEGRVVDADGQPVEGVAIGISEFHRGPWSHSDEDGRFRLVGLDSLPGHGVYFGLADCTREGWARDLQGVVPLPLEGVPLLIRLPSHPDEVEGNHWDLPEPETDQKVRVVIRARGVEDVSAVPLLASRRSDGLTLDAEVGADGSATLELAPGTWVLEAGWPRPSESEELGAVRAEVEVPQPGGAAPIVLALPTPRLLRTALGPVAVSGSVEVVTERAVYGVTERARAGQPFPVPATGDVHLRFDAEGTVRTRPRVLPVPANFLEAGADPMPVRLPQPVTVRLRSLDPAGSPLPTRVVALTRRGSWGGRHVDADAEPLETEHELQLHPDTTPIIAIEPAQGAPFATRFVRVPQPTKPSSALDLGSVTLEPVVPSKVRVIVSDTASREEPEGLWAKLRRYPLRIRVVAGGERYAASLSLQEDGNSRLEWAEGEPRTIPPGAGVWLIPGASSLPDMRVAFPRSGTDLTVRWPTAELRLEVVGADDQSLRDDTIVVDGRLIDGGPPPARALGLAAGLHSVLISAPGYASQHHTIRLEEGQVVSRKITLRRLP